MLPMQEISALAWHSITELPSTYEENSQVRRLVCPTASAGGVGRDFPHSPTHSGGLSARGRAREDTADCDAKPCQRSLAVDSDGVRTLSMLLTSALRVGMTGLSQLPIPMCRAATGVCLLAAVTPAGCTCTREVTSGRRTECVSRGTSSVAAEADRVLLLARQIRNSIPPAPCPSVSSWQYCQTGMNTGQNRDSQAIHHARA